MSNELLVINGLNIKDLNELGLIDHTHKIGNMETGPEIIKGNKHFHEIPGIGKTNLVPDTPEHIHSVATKTGKELGEEKPLKKKLKKASKKK